VPCGSCFPTSITLISFSIMFISTAPDSINLRTNCFSSEFLWIRNNWLFYPSVSLSTTEYISAGSYFLISTCTSTGSISAETTSSSSSNSSSTSLETFFSSKLSGFISSTFNSIFCWILYRTESLISSEIVTSFSIVFQNFSHPIISPSFMSILTDMVLVSWRDLTWFSDLF